MHFSLMDILGIGETSIVAVLAILAMVYGAGPEKACALTPVLMALLDRIYHSIFGSAIYHTVDFGHFFIDFIALFIFATVSIHANRVYPIWVAAWQFIAVISHFTRGMSEAVGLRAYAILIMAPSLFEIALIGAGLALHVRRKRRYVRYRSWRASSSLSSPAGLPNWLAG